MENEVKLIQVLIGLAKIDGYLHPTELKWLKSLINRYPFSESEKQILNNEFKKATDSCLNIFRSIESYFTRSAIIDFSRHLFQIDGRFCSKEREVFEQLKKIHNDLSPGVAKLQQEVSSEMAKDEKNKSFYREIDTVGKISKVPVLLPASLWGFTYLPFLLTKLIFEGGRFGLKIAIFIIIVIIIYFASGIVSGIR